MDAWPHALGQNIMEARACGTGCSPYVGQEARRKR
jgi:hypothetical protein